ncbi:MAG: phosphoribosylformylglycinamidine synthase I [Candidatus Omnitrophota bacterium]
MNKPRILILRTAGTNCDRETAFAFELAGGEPDLVHINELARGEKSLRDYQIFAIPGGFTYGDDIASGKILANEVRYKLGEETKNFINAGKLVIGICNGFQALVKAGFLPAISGNDIEATLSFNNSGSFIAKWVELGKSGDRCVWTKGVKGRMYLPIAHGEGKFIPRDKDVLRALRKNGQVVFRYEDNPNGSVDDIAGICDTTGRILGMMPHPERHVLGTQHPQWTRKGLKRYGDGFDIFKNGIQYVKEFL